MEKYKGIKYKLHFLGKNKPKHKRLNELIKWCRIFHQHGLTPLYESGSYGNLSFRTDDNEFIITGSHLKFKKNLTPLSFVKIVKCLLNKKEVYAIGEVTPSSETLLHYMIYKNRPDVNAVFHGHDPLILNYASQLKVPQTFKYESYGSVKLIYQVKKILNEGDFLIMKHHGFISLGKTMKEAGKQALKMHKKAALLSKVSNSAT